MNEILIKAPATIANLSCGFDILGVCIEEPYDEIKISKISEKKIKINILDSPFSNIPVVPSKNTGGIPAELIINDFKLDYGFEINIKKGIPLCGGLGSSAATAVGVVFGINQLLSNVMSKNEMIKYALEGEKISSKTPHADNIGPCLMGGLVIIRDIDKLDLIHIPLNDLFFAIIHPDIKVDTKTARKILPDEITLNKAIKQWGNISALTYGFISNDIKVIKRSMIDHIIEPIRSEFIPFYSELKKAGNESGAIGCSISGSGPSIFALCTSENVSKQVLKEMENVLADKSIKYHSYISPINNQGVSII